MRDILLGSIGSAWITFALVWLIASLKSKSAVRVQSLGSRAVQSLLIVTGYFLLFSDKTAVGFLGYRVVPPSLEWACTGAGLVLAGLLFAVWARFFLGSNWSARVTVKQNHELVKSGPYSIVRHPIYLGLLLAMSGSALAFGEVHSFLALLSGFAGFKLKSVTEEKFMRGQFREAYAQYQREVKGLIPFVW